MKRNYNLKEWICTDPSEGQYGRRLDWHRYEFKDNLTEPCIIDLSEYNIHALDSMARSYGYIFFEKGERNYNFLGYLWLLAEIVYELDYANKRLPNDT